MRPELTGRKITDAELVAVIERLAARWAELIDYDAYSVVTFARRHSISLQLFYKLRAAGLGPDEIHVGARRLISKESARRWRRKMERRTADSSEAVTGTAPTAA
jgi:hypothetical protein